MKTILTLFIPFWTMLTLAGCSLDTTTTPGTQTHQGESVKIGVIAPLSGPASSYGQDAVNTITDLVGAYQSTHPSPQIELIIEDGKCNGKDAASAAQKLISIDKVDVLLGGQCSSETLSAGKIAQQYGVTLLSPLSSSPAITQLGDYVFRFWNDAFSSITISDYLNTHHPTIALIVENTDYAKAIAEKLKEYYTGTILFESNFNSEEKDFDIIAQSINKQSPQPDAIVFLNQTESTGIGFIKSLEKTGLLTRYRGKIVGAFLFSLRAFLDAVGSASEDLIQGNLEPYDTSNTDTIDYISYFEDRYGVKSESRFIALLAESTALTLDAISAGIRDSEGFKTYFEGITAENPRNGYFGEYYFDENGDILGLRFVMQQIKNGVLYTLE